MASVPLQIVMHGLIALVPMNDADGANHMTALLVDARNQPPGMELPCFAPHVPELRLTPTSTALCRPAGCSVSGNSCVCTLSRQNITLSIDPPPMLARKLLRKQPNHSLPFSLADASDFSYIANLAQLPPGWKLDQRFLTPVPPDELVARMEFPFEAVKACSLGVRQDEGSRNVHPFSFRPHGALEKPGDVSQALAQQAVAFLQISDQARVIVRLEEFGGNGHDLAIKVENLSSGEMGYRVELVNMRMPDPLALDDPCDDGVGRDFAYFYELVLNKPPIWRDRPMPHIKYTRWKSANDLTTEDCTRPTHVPSSRPICPMASFN